MSNFCTLFDSSFLTRGLAMYESLKKHCKDFQLFIFAFDEKCYQILQELKLEKAKIISLVEFETDDLKRIKKQRSRAEYCWTCTPFVIKHSIENFKLKQCIYLDADIYFFANPKVLLEEMGEKSILITEHRYTKKYERGNRHGIYCVQFICFKNDPNGMKALNWWAKACLMWCYARYEDGRFGDQKYLDDWTTRFKGIHVLQNLGGGVAPWNVQQYDLSDSSFELIFYHFHQYSFLNGNRVDFGIYKLESDVIESIYKPYTKHLMSITERLKMIDSTYDFNGIVEQNILNWRQSFKKMVRRIKGIYKIYKIEDLVEE